MVQDPTGQYIATILSHCELHGKDVLEIGCGKGRITQDLAAYARRVVASDPDGAALEKARARVKADNVEFVHAPCGVPEHSPRSFDAVIYTLSLHHVPVTEMHPNLGAAGDLLKKEGVIIVIEPGDGGSLTEAKERFGVGSGDERPEKQAAIQAMQSLEGWSLGQTVHFRTLFQYEDEEDFLANMLPGFREQPVSKVNEIRQFISRYRTADGRIILDADRRLNVISRRGCQG